MVIEMATKKGEQAPLAKYVLVEEEPLTGGKPSQVLLQVLKETSKFFITREVFPLNLVDLTSTYNRAKQVRWCIENKCRAGDDHLLAVFRIKKIIDATEFPKYAELLY
jgi:hypothetical protein